MTIAREILSRSLLKGRRLTSDKSFVISNQNAYIVVMRRASDLLFVSQMSDASGESVTLPNKSNEEHSPSR